MTWLAPMAWLGLVVLAVPVVIHLLGRRSARVQRYPTLRFIGAAPLVATRRTRLTDVALLLVRMGILLAAVAALARPYLRTGPREAAASRAVARAIIVDTSRSVSGATLEARRVADSIAAVSAPGLVVATSTPHREIAGAGAWLASQRGTRELVVVSDFQREVLHELDLARVAPGTGVSLRRVVVPTGVVADTTAPATGTGALTILAGADERTGADAALAAAQAIGGWRAPADAARPVVIVHRGAGERASLLQAATAIDSPWMAAVVAAMRHDSLLIAAAGATSATTTTARFDSAKVVAVAMDPNGAPVVAAARVEHSGAPALALFMDADAGSVASAALLVAVGRAAGGGIDPAELDPATIDDSTLARWQRPAAVASIADPGDASDGRWLWLVALALMAVEWWMRRRVRVVPDTREVVRDRAA